MKTVLARYLSKFENTVDVAHQQQALDTCRRVFGLANVEQLPYVASDVKGAPDQNWPMYAYNDTFVDPEKMLLDQLRAPFLHNQLHDYHPLNVRSNYGTVILPSVFGLSYQLTETSLPWVHHLENRAQVRALINRGVPDIKTGLGGRCFETAAYYRETLSAYPHLSKAVSIYHPDLQGPFDVAHLIWGPDIFYALYDCPDVVHSLVALITETYRCWMWAWKTWVGEGNDFTTHWNFYMKGGIMLRDDTAVTMSTRHYEEFVKPYDQILLDEFGGCIHFCGKAKAFIGGMCASRCLNGIHMSQPELNDVPAVLALAEQHKLVVMGLPEAYLPCKARTGFIVLR
jgi:hypothetical protein